MSQDANPDTDPDADPEAAGHLPPPDESHKEFLEPMPLVRVRRSPNFVRFMLSGGAIGLAIGFLVDLVGTQDARYGALSSMAFVGLGFAALGVLGGALVAVLLDRS